MTNEVKWIVFLRIYATFAVVLVHSAAEVMFGMPHLEKSQWYAGLFYNAISRWCVPVFVMITGVLLLAKPIQSVRDFYSKRIWRIAIPLITWAIVYQTVEYINRISNGGAFSLLYAVNKIVIGAPALHLWYLYMLIGMYFFIPVIQKVILTIPEHRLPVFTLALLAVPNIIGGLLSYFLKLNCLYLPPYLPFPFWFFPYVGYCVAGYMIFVMDVKSNLFVLFSLFILSVFLMAFQYLTGAEYNENNLALFGLSFYGPSVTLMSITLFLLVKNFHSSTSSGPLIKFLSNSTLGIYIIHPLLLNPVSTFFKQASVFSPWFWVPLAALVAFIASAILTGLIKKIPILKMTV